MVTKKKRSQAAGVQGILKILGAKQRIIISKLAEELGVAKKAPFIGILRF